MIITMQHVRTVPNGGQQGYCVAGLRRFFERHGLDLKTFVKQGLPEEVFMATGDQQAVRLVEHARGWK